MRGLLLSAALVAVGLAATPAPVSDWVGVYAVIDRVVFEPDEQNPERVQVWGVFVLARTVVRDEQGEILSYPDYNALHPARRGYLYYRSLPEDMQRSHIEWRDLKSVAGTGMVVAYGSRFPGESRLRAWRETVDSSVAQGNTFVPLALMEHANGRIRRASEAPRDPDPYPIGVGVSRFQSTRWEVLHATQRVPAPMSPADGATVPAGSIRLVTANVSDPEAKYVFEIREGDGPVETSDAITAGNGQTSWTPRLRVRSGVAYTWRVRAVWDGVVSEPAEVAFRGDGGIERR